MKTSNKLLIGLAVLLLVAPLSLLAFYLNKMYIGEDIFKKEVKNFNKAIKGFAEIKLQPFKGVEFKDAKEGNIDIVFIKSETSGIRFPQNKASQINYHINDLGILSIDLKKEDEKKPSLTLYFYGPHLHHLMMNNGNNIDFQENGDIIEVTAAKINQLNMTTKTAIDKVSIKASEVNELSLIGPHPRVININLNKSIMSSWNIPGDSLNIQVNNAQLGIGDQGENRISSKVVNISAKGKSELRLQNLHADQIKADIDPSTILTMDAATLHKIYQKQ